MQYQFDPDKLKQLCGHQNMAGIFSAHRGPQSTGESRREQLHFISVALNHPPWPSVAKKLLVIYRKHPAQSTHFAQIIGVACMAGDSFNSKSLKLLYFHISHHRTD